MSENSEIESKIQKPASRRSLLGGILLVILVLALALGLGLGLKHGMHADSPSNSTNGLTIVPRSQLVDSSQLVLLPSFDVNTPPQSREFNWTLSEIISDPTGTSKNMLVVNGISPGPTIEANFGDRIIVQVTNNLPNVTSIHWHGQNQNGTNYMDGTFGITECGIAPGSTFAYNWTVQNVGTFWWHAHYATQYSDGVFGALILHSPNDTLKFSDGASSNTSNTVPVRNVLDAGKSEYPSKARRASNPSAITNTTYDGDLIFFVGDVYNTLSSIVLQSYLSPDGPDGTQGDEPVGDGGLVNGIGKSNCDFAPAGSTCDGGSNYNFTVEPGKRYRMRIVNSGSFANIRFSVDGHALTVVEADATAVVPILVQSVELFVAQRYSVIIETNQQPGAYYVRGEVMTDMFNYDNLALVTEQNAVMRYAGISETTMPNDTVPALDGVTQDLNTDLLVPVVPITPPPATRTETVFVTFELTTQNTWGAFFNGTAWAPETNGNATVFQTAGAAITNSSFSSDSQFIITNNDIEVFDLVINNQDDGDHPFHLHGHTVLLLGTGPGDYQGQANLTQPNPMRRDTFVVPAYSWGVVRFVTDNPGLWALHCHIVWHMEAGLLMQFSNLPSKIAQFQFPQSMRDQCNAIAARG